MNPGLRSIVYVKQPAYIQQFTSKRSGHVKQFTSSNQSTTIYVKQSVYNSLRQATSLRQAISLQQSTSSSQCLRQAASLYPTVCVKKIQSRQIDPICIKQMRCYHDDI
uniref:Uncharacterized protein n=1 Tax=Loa loa TaxID=7209 RepID=A0A1I7V618_LOALO